MGNLATLLVKFGAAFLLACHADYTLAQDNASGKSSIVRGDSASSCLTQYRVAGTRGAVCTLKKNIVNFNKYLVEYFQLNIY